MVFVLPLAITPLAALGADVIKVETADRPDSVRWGPAPDNTPRPDGYNHGAHFQMLNRNKRGITLDLTKPSGRELLLRLVAVSDVVAENFTPRVLENLGLTYEHMRAVNPRIILLSSSGFGQTGPWRNYRAYGPNTEAVDGLMNITGYPDGPPVRGGAGGMGVAFTDASGGFYGTFAILAALERRQRTGQGAWLDLSHYEAGVATVPEAVMEASMNGRVATRQANRDPSRVPQGCYPCDGEDRWIAISIRSDDEFRTLATVIDQPQMAEDARFVTLASRWTHHDELDQLISAWTAIRTSDDVERMLQAAGVEATKVATPRDVWFDDQLHSRGFFERVPSAPAAPEIGSRPHLRAAWKMSSTTPRPPARAPEFGQHTEEVLRELLSVSDDELKRLAADGVIAKAPTPGRLARSGAMNLNSLVASGRLREIDPLYRERLEGKLTLSRNLAHDSASRDKGRTYSPGEGKLTDG
jgi:crotonobetainyl-CoA:carnitine CoA-transferase CaiB-like acyl-CoA transferase